MLKQPCYFYNTTGKCRFGKHCKFVHELGTQTEIHQSARQDEISVRRQSGSLTESNSISSVTSSNGKQNESIKKKVEQRVRQEGICNFYATGRFCRFGRRCRFQHVRQHASEQVCDDLKASQNAEQNKVQDEEKKEDVEDEPIKVEENGCPEQKLLSNVKETKDGKSRRKICKFFKEGNCRFGKRCRFFHPPSGVTLADNFQDLELSKAKSSSTNEDSGTKSQAQRPARPPQVIQILKRNEISQDKVADLHRTEIAQLKRRFPADRLKIVEEGNGKESFIFTFTPTDPDWPFDVKSFDIEVEFDKEYPMKTVNPGPTDSKGKHADPDQTAPSGAVLSGSTLFAKNIKSSLHELFTLSLPLDQNLPETVRWYTEKSIREWTNKQQKDGERNGTVELLFRPFLRWLDRNIEDIVTEGLKQLRRELQAQSAGIQFVSAKDLRKDFDDQATEASDEDSGPACNTDDNHDVVVYRKNKDSTEEVYQVPERGDLSNSSSDEDGTNSDDDDDEDSDGNDNKPGSDNIEHKRPNINPDTERRGTEMIFRNMQIWYITTLLMEKLHLTVKCERCKAMSDFSTPPNRANSLQCGKCNNSMMVAFRAVLTHSYSSTFGYLDVDGCTAFDVILQDCHFSLGCIVCSRDILVKKITPGKVMELWCRGCHNKMKFATDSVRLRVLDTSGGVDTSLYSGNVHKVNIKKQRRVLKDPAIQEGKPLPDNGACKHYKKSYRWLRFPCCGKAYPCDICHEDKEDHEMLRANRMICGHCCREQSYAAERPCVGCSSALTKVKTSHWEGGRGCRDRIAMSKSDDRKYSNLNKTVSSKAQALKEKSKSKKNTTKLSSAKAAQK